MKISNAEQRLIDFYVNLRHEVDKIESYLREKGLVDEEGVPVYPGGRRGGIGGSYVREKTL